MHSRSRRAPLCRLLQIVVALQSDRLPNALQLADEFEVSRRTIFRDLDTIAEAGLPVEYDTARQGYRIASAKGPKAVTFEEREVMAVAVLLSARGDADPFGLQGPARSAVVKLVNALPDPARSRVESIDLATHGQSPPGPIEAHRRPVYDAILESIGRGVQLRVTVRVPGRGVETTRLSPYRLVSRRDGWSVVGRSSLHRDVRLVPLARVESAEPTDDPSVIPPRFRVDRWLSRSWSGTTHVEPAAWPRIGPDVPVSHPAAGLSTPQETALGG